MTKAIFQLEPLTCPTCVKKIETALRKQTGVELVKVLFNSSKVKSEYDGTKISIEEQAEIIEKLGYKVLSKKTS